MKANGFFICYSLCSSVFLMAIENINDSKIEKNGKESQSVTNCCGYMFNNVNSYEEQGKLVDKIRFSVSQINNNCNTFKVIFKLESDDSNKLFNLNPNNFYIYFLDDKGNEIKENNIITNWFGNPVSSGDSLQSVKKTFLGNSDKSKFFGNGKSADNFSVSFKLSKRLDNELFIKIIYKINELEKPLRVSDCNEEQDDKHNYMFDLYSFFSKFDKEYEDIFKSIIDKCTCTAVRGFKNSIKLIFPTNDELLKGNFKSRLKIFIYDENGDEIKDNVLYKWLLNEDNEKIFIKNGMDLCDIKRGFLSKYKNSEYKSDPFSISMRVVEDNKYKKIKIKILFSDELSFFVKNDDSDIIDLEKMNESVKSNNSVSVSNINDDEYRNIVKDLFKGGIKIINGCFKNTIKILFTQNAKLIDNKRNNFKLYIFDKDGNEVKTSIKELNIGEPNTKNEINNDENNDWVLAKWLLKENNFLDIIESGSKISDIKRLFLVNSTKYSKNDPFSLSLRINREYVEKNGFKIKVVYDDGIGEVLETDFITFEGF